MSHMIRSPGISEGFLGIDGNIINRTETVRRFNGCKCTSFIGKPKFIIIRGCDHVDIGVVPKEVSTNRSDLISSMTIHSDFDCLVLLLWLR